MSRPHTLANRQVPAYTFSMSSERAKPVAMLCLSTPCGRRPGRRHAPGSPAGRPTSWSCAAWVWRTRASRGLGRAQEEGLQVAELIHRDDAAGGQQQDAPGHRPPRPSAGFPPGPAGAGSSGRLPAGAAAAPAGRGSSAPAGRSPRWRRVLGGVVSSSRILRSSSNRPASLVSIPRNGVVPASSSYSSTPSE
jgi:hypothetical protein